MIGLPSDTVGFHGPGKKFLRIFPLFFNTLKREGELMTSENKVIYKQKKIPWREIEGEVIIVDLDKENVLNLNATGKEIWNSINGTLSAADITQKLTEIYEVEEAQAKKDVTLFINKLLEKGLIHY